MNFVVSVVLARLLAPEDFGLIAMLAVFIALADAFVDSGLSAALIQKREITAADESTMFYLNVAIAFGAYAVLWLAAPFVAWFYELPALTILLRVLALGVVIRSLAIIQTTLLRRQLDFRSLFLRSLVSLPVSGAVGLIMAYRGFGVWSLVTQQLISGTLSVACFWLLSSWRPRWLFSRQSFKDLTGYGSRQLVIGLMDTLFQNSYEVVIGKLFAPAALGFYSRAVHLEKLATSNLVQIINRVAFPLFCAVHQDADRLRRAASKSLAMMAMAVFPVMAGLMVVAHPLVEVLLSAKWLPCVPYLQLLCVVGLLYPLQVINVNILRARGQMDVFLRLEFIKKALTVIAIVLTYRWGILAMICGQIVQAVAAYFLNAHYGGKGLEYSWGRQLRDVLPYAAATLLMMAAIGLTGCVALHAAWSQLLLQVVVGMSVYLGCCHLCGLEEYREVHEWGARQLSAAGLRLGAGGPDRGR